MNSVNLTGRLTADVELKYTNSNMAVARFSLAVDKELSKEKKEEFRRMNKPTADFPRILVFGKQAENCANYLAKGRRVAIKGRIQTGSYENAQGQRVFTTDIVAEKVEFLDYRNSHQGQQSQNDYDNSGFEPIDDEDIPF